MKKPWCRVYTGCARKNNALNGGDIYGVKKKKPPEQAVFADMADCKARLRDYFEVYLASDENEVADIESLADYLGTTREGIFAMESGEYGFELRKARNRIAKIKKQLAFRGKLPSAVLSFDLKNNHGYRDKTEDGAEADTVIIRGIAKGWAK